MMGFNDDVLFIVRRAQGRSFTKNGELLDIRRVHISPNNSAVNSVFGE